MAGPSRTEYVDPKYAKTGTYAETIADIIKSGRCPFCPDVFPGKWHTNPILKTHQDWLITRSTQPYSGSKDHLILVGNRHITEIGQLSEQDMVSVFRLAQWATLELNLPGGALALRFGASEFIGATVSHLHAHLIVPQKIDDKIQVVNFPIG